ncbi:MAG TPA: hypothetical protein VG755_03375 [Nannocystaceae bacterium]|nr:hypothetical protein [Nannocystaceae bacterium]
MKIERDEGGAGAPRRRAQESSVVFSLASLRAMVEDDARPSTRASLPSFSGTELGGVPAASVTPMRAPVIASVVPPPSNAPLMMMLGMLLLTTIALGAYVVMTPRQHVVITRVVTPAADAVDRVVEPIAVQPELRAETIAPIEPPTREEPVVKPEPERRTTPRTRTRPREETRTVVPVVPEPERRGDVPLECVLDPSLPKCGGKTKAPPPVEPKTKVDPNLPETLGNADIRNGIAAVKSSAKMCGDKFGGTAGEKVRVKLSIVGATGAVSSTAAEDPHRGTALGNCVAAALKKATFPHFRKSVIGVEYTITL